MKTRGLQIVSNNKILDAGLIKYVDECIEMKTRLSTLKDRYYEEYQRLYIMPWEAIKKYREQVAHNERVKRDLKMEHQRHIMLQTDIYEFDELRRNLEKKLIKYSKTGPIEPPFMKHPDEMNQDDYYRYYNLERFERCYMINISPDWKGQDKMREKRDFMVRFITQFIEDCNRWSKYDAVIECGGDADFCHAHIVLEINPSTYKSTMTSIKKGNLLSSMLRS
jgi:hypothetical protein